MGNSGSIIPYESINATRGYGNAKQVYTKETFTKCGNMWDIRGLLWSGNLSHLKLNKDIQSIRIVYTRKKLKKLQLKFHSNHTCVVD